MAFPQPAQGLVIRYSSLRLAEHRRGLEEGRKDRPCAVTLVTTLDGDGRIVTVLPTTHTPPTVQRFAAEIPPLTKERLRLDAERSWVLLSEANRFVWPGLDVRPLVTGDAATVAYGLLPYRLIDDIRRKFLGVLKDQQARIVGRSE